MNGTSYDYHKINSFVSNKILAERKKPFLHVAESNTGAISLYEKPGFYTSGKISFRNYIKEQR